MRFPFSAFINPASEKLYLIGGEASIRAWRRHAHLWLSCGDTFDQSAVRRIARTYYASLGECTLLGVKTKASLSLPVIRTVACETCVREDRADIAIEIDGRLFPVLCEDCTADRRYNDSNQRYLSSRHFLFMSGECGKKEGPSRPRKVTPHMSRSQSH